MGTAAADPGDSLAKVGRFGMKRGARLPELKRPKAAYVLDRLPKSDRGKIRRDALKEIWAESAGAAS